MMIEKEHKLFFLLLLVSVIGVMIFLTYQFRTSRPQKSPPKVFSHKYQKHRLQIRGFQFDGHDDGERVISIKADRFSIEKKKLGFFRLGLLNVARFENAVIDIYGKGKDPSRRAAGKSSQKAADRSQTNLQVPGDVTFKGIFKKETLPSFPVKRISAIVIEPVSLNLYQEESLLTHINASSATIRLKGRSILFKGNVEMVSGSRSLRTEQLIFLPEEGVIKTNRPFELKTPSEQWDGARLSTDIYLRDVRSESKRSKTL